MLRIRLHPPPLAVLVLACLAANSIAQEVIEAPRSLSSLAGGWGGQPVPGVEPVPALPPTEGLGWLHPIAPPAPEVTRMCAAIPAAERDRTYVFFINGIDYVGASNLKGLCDYLRCVGFHNSEWGSMFHSSSIRRRIACVRGADPAARIVILGYSWGANKARSLANALNEDGVCVDLLIYVGGDTIGDADRSRPPNVRRIVNITGHGFAAYGLGMLYRGSDIAGAENMRLSTYHFALPSRPETVEAVVRAVAETALTPPAVEYVTQPGQPLPPPAPGR
jgi:hypothetical protein